MWLKFWLGVGFVLMLSFAFFLEPGRRVSFGDRGKARTHFRI